MKSLVLTLSGAFLMITAYACGCGVCKAEPAVEKYTTFIVGKEEPKTITLKITGMTCAGCASHIHKALSATNGVINDEVKFPGNLAVIKYDPSKISEKEIISVIEKTGYKAEIIIEKKSI